MPSLDYELRKTWNILGRLVDDHRVIVGTFREKRCFQIFDGVLVRVEHDAVLSEVRLLLSRGMRRGIHHLLKIIDYTPSKLLYT